MEEFAKKAIDLLTQAGGKILLAIVILIVGRLVIKWLLKFLDKGRFINKLEPTVRSFIRSFIKIGLHIILVISIIGVLGVPMASIVTVLASCGVAIGMALQGALSNLAGGIMLLVFKPFRVGDFIGATGADGTVKEVSLFYTVLNTVDNKQVTIPNGTLMGANVTNCSAEETRRVDLTFNIGAGNEIETVQKVIQDTIARNGDVLHAPAEPFAAPVEGVPGGMKYAVRVWAKGDKYWDVYNALMKDISTALGEAGIGGPLTHVKMEEA
ncbi:MAG: mechanosensitive ion channel family protein [Parasporobacterium sp.]|nr:mechanosensitive ion channel family protein [Parasporobacterium sp.]